MKNSDEINSQKSPARIFSAKEPTNTLGGSTLIDPLPANFKSVKLQNKNSHSTLNNLDKNLMS